MRVLFSSTAGAGHLNPLKPWIRACVGRGDEVLLVVPPGAADDARAIGVPVVVGAAPDEDLGHRTWTKAMSLPPDEARAFIGREIFGGINTDAMVPAARAGVADFGPDLVIREPMEYAASIAAAEAEVRQVRVGIVQAETDAGFDVWSAQRPAERVPGLRQTITASTYLTRFPASVDPDGYSDTRRYRHPETPAAALPDWWPGRTGPLVYVTFGTEAPRSNQAETLFRTALAAVADLPARVLVTVGRDFDRALLGELPDNTHVEPWAEHAAVLPEAAVVLHHGGSGSTLDCLSAGAPQVVLPLFADQPDNAAMVEAAGLGISLANEANDAPMRFLEPDEASAINAALLAALAEPSLGERARRVQQEMAEVPPLAEVLAGL